MNCMRVAKTCAWAAVVAGAIAVASAQLPAQTPKNPVNTKPEGQAPSCSFSASRGDGKTTGSSTCPANSAQRFPYPGEAPSQQDLTGGKVDTQQPVDDPQTQQPASAVPASSAQKFPYPGEAPSGDKGGAPAGGNSPLQDAGSSGSSSQPDSSSSSSSNPSAPGENPFLDDPADKPGDLPAPKRARKKLPAVPAQSPDEREEEDVRIGNFYQSDGNYRAAYGRAKDAIALTETDPEAHFLLAESARKLGRLDEAVQHYKRCLELDPLPKQKKESQKALKEMAGS